MEDNKKSYKLTCFPCYGPSEAIRVALVKGQCTWEQALVTWDDWEKDEEVKKTTVRGVLPCLQVNNGPMMDEALALVRYVCMQEGLYPDDIDEAYEIERALQLL